MNTDRKVDVGTVLSSIADMLKQNQSNLNDVDPNPRGGTHGDRMAQAFQTAAEAARKSGTNDAGEQLAVAAQVMRERGQGKAAGYYADGLEDAAQQFGGQSGISLSSLGPFLQAFVGGVQRNNPAQPGQGTMLDALLPAVGALTGGSRQADPRQSALGALGEAVMGARGTAQQGGRVDAGAASATGVLGGIISALLPGIMTAIMSRMGQRNQQPQPQVSMPQVPGGGVIGTQDDSPGGGLGDLLGQIMGGGQGQSRDQDYDQPSGGGGGPLGGLGDILGKLMPSGGSSSSRQSKGNEPGWWPF